MYIDSFYTYTILLGKHYCSILQLKKLRHRGVKQIAQGHAVGKWQGWDSNPGNLPPESMLLTTSYAASQGTYQDFVQNSGGADFMPSSFV